MGDWPRLVNLRRCARGLIYDSGEMTNTTIALFNNSAAAELLLVWQIGSAAGEVVTPQFSYQQGLSLTPGGFTESVVPGDALPPGVLSSGDQPSAFPASWSLNTVAPAYDWPATFPFAVLLPGWSLVAQPIDGGTDPIAISFWWEAILSEYFDRMHSALCVELELRAASKS